MITTDRPLHSHDVYLVSTVDNPASLVTAARVWNSLEQHVISAPSSLTLATPKTLSFSPVTSLAFYCMYCVRAVTAAILDSSVVNLLTYLITPLSFSPSHIRRTYKIHSKSSKYELMHTSCMTTLVYAITS